MTLYILNYPLFRFYFIFRILLIYFERVSVYANREKGRGRERISRGLHSECGNRHWADFMTLRSQPERNQELDVQRTDAHRRPLIKLF